MDHSPNWLIKTFLFLLIFLTSLTGCSDPNTPTPIPTGEFVDLYYPPVLDYLRSEIGYCIRSINSISPILYKQSGTYTTLQSGAIILSLGEADLRDGDHFVTLISTQEIFFITNSANPTQSLGIDELKAIFTGNQLTWNETSNIEGPITIWGYPEGSELSVWIKNSLLEKSIIALDSNIAPDPGILLESISKDVNAIGYLPESWLSNVDSLIRNKINVLKIESTPTEFSPLPVLAYLNEKPTGAVRDLLVCLQSEKVD